MDIRTTWAWIKKSHFLATPETAGTISKVLVSTFKCFIIQQDYKNRSVSDKNVKASLRVEMDDDSKDKATAQDHNSITFFYYSDPPNPGPGPGHS